MARLVARIKVLPADVDVNLDDMVKKLEGSLPDGMKIKNHRKEPIAFGLNALLVDFVMDDKEGQMDALEEMIRKVEGVSEIEVMNLSRESANL